MKYIDALQYISEISAIKGSILGLDSIRELCKRLGNPQNELKFVHIAGTNGKGSTLSFIQNILTNSGYKTGCYISPTIRDYRERYQINGKMITQKAFVEYIDIIKKVCEEMTGEGLEHPTAFEIETAIAFMYFRDSKCDVVVLETGMGGIDDATNIITTTVLSVLVSISMDHMQFLGNTIEEIAMKKCGIIKDHSQVVSGIQQDAVRGIIDSVCQEKCCGLKFLARDEITGVKRNINKQSFVLNKERYEISLAGVWQTDNASTAVLAANVLRDRCGYDKITTESIKKGLSKTCWQARFQTVSKKPLLIVDGAHNEDAAKRLRESIDCYFSKKNKIYILGMFRDKEVDKVVSTIVYDGKMIFTCAAPDNPRAMTPVELAKTVKNYNENVTCCDSVEEAVEFATSIAGNDDVIIACGSLAYLGKIIDIYDIK